MNLEEMGRNEKTWKKKDDERRKRERETEFMLVCHWERAERNKNQLTTFDGRTTAFIEFDWLEIQRTCKYTRAARSGQNDVS